MQTYKILFHGYAIVTAESEDEAIQLFFLMMNKTHKKLIGTK